LLVVVAVALSDAGIPGRRSLFRERKKSQRPHEEWPVLSSECGGATTPAGK
jgi:hypothetical protein